MYPVGLNSYSLTRVYQQATTTIIIIITVISVAPYLTDKIEHTVLYKMNENNNHMVITLSKFLTHHTITEQFGECLTNRRATRPK